MCENAAAGILAVVTGLITDDMISVGHARSHDRGWLRPVWYVASVCVAVMWFHKFISHITERWSIFPPGLRAEMLLTCGCLFGWKLTNFPFFFSPPFHSTLSLAFPLSSIAVIDNHMWSCHVQVFVCGCLLLLLLLLFVILPFILFAPSLKHPPLVCSSVLFLSTGEFSSSLPPLFLVYQPPLLPPPLLPLSLPAAFPKKSTCYRQGLWIAQGLSCDPLTLRHSSRLMHVGAFSPVVPRRHVVPFQDYFQRITNRAMYLTMLWVPIVKVFLSNGSAVYLPGWRVSPFLLLELKKDIVKLVNNRAHLHSAHIFSHFPPHRVLYCRS